MSYKPIAPAPTGSNHTPPGSCGSSPSLASSSNFRPAFSDFGPPSMGFVQPVKVSQGSTYSELLSVIEEMSREIRPTYAGSKSAMERLKRGIIHTHTLPLVLVSPLFFLINMLLLFAKLFTTPRLSIFLIDLCPSFIAIFPMYTSCLGNAISIEIF
uniref:Cyclin-dependent kinase 2 associated protein 2 n=1 Tax=Cyprinus carpio TaxID=7962 RepID=A0A8C1LX25_CYPCA